MQQGLQNGPFSVGQIAAVPPPKPGGRSVSWERREIVDVILYVLRSGGPWRLLPHDFPPWQTV